MKRLEQVRQILESLVSGQSFGAHGPFWRGLGHQEFTELQVFGQKLVDPGNSAQSNLVRALRGEAPFGADLQTPGAFFRRMPAGRPPATELQIDYIARWIDDGCPDEDEATALLATTVNLVDPVAHNAYWREFDDWAMFNAAPDVRGAINAFFAVAPRWFAFAKGTLGEAEWDAATRSPAVQGAVALLTARQRETVERHYGSPPVLQNLLESYWKFGAGVLPPDPLRPQDPTHSMNGPQMWFFWSAFADAAIRLGEDVSFWFTEIRAILVGLLHDGLFRRRFSVQGFTADSEGTETILEFAAKIPDEKLTEEMRARYSQSGL